MEYTKGWMWRVGLGLVFFGSLADFAALSFGPQSLVAPLGSLTLVSNVIFAPLLLRETIGHWDVLATVLIVVGSSVAVMFGSHESVTFTCLQLFTFFTRWSFILYATIMTIYIGVLYMFIQKIEKIEKDEGVHSPRYLHYRGLHRFAYPSLSGTVGAQSVLFAKAFVSLLTNTVRHWNASDEEVIPLAASHTLSTDGTMQNVTEGLPDSVDTAPIILHHVSENMFVHWQTYFIFAAMLGAIFAQIKYLNEGLKRFDASYAVPVFTSFWIILSVLSGMIFYQEYVGMDTGQCLFFAFGVLVTVTGVITLGGREQTHHGHQVLVQEDADSESGFAAAQPTNAQSVHQEGSLNPGVDAADRRTPQSSYAHHHHSREHGDHEDQVEVDLDVDDIGVGDSIVSPSGHAQVHHVSVRSTRIASVDEAEGTVTDGAKTAVLEASQRISAAFQKLRGKGHQVGQVERDAINSIHSAISSSSSSGGVTGGGGRIRSDSHDVATDHSDFASATDDEDPLILKNKGKAQSRKSPRNITLGSSEQSDHPGAYPQTNNTWAAATEQITNSNQIATPKYERSSSLTAAALYDPSFVPSGSGSSRTNRTESAPSATKDRYA